MAEGDMQQNAGALQNLVTVQQQGVKNLGLIYQALQQVFTMVTGTSGTATAGAAGALPATAEGYLDVTLTDGTQVKVPYYNP